MRARARTNTQRDGERERGIYYAWKEDGRETGAGGMEGGFGRMRAGEEEERTWKHARRTRADASIRGTGWHAGHACTYTRVPAYVHTWEDTRERGAGTSESARDTGYATGTKLRSP